MNKGKLNKVIAEGNIVIPIYILKCFKKLNLTMDEFVFLMYLYNKQDKVDFNPEKIALDLNMDIMEVMGYVSVLTDKGYITLDVIKGVSNILEEVINLDNFYEKISMFLIDNSLKEVDENQDEILKYIEKQLGRPLSSIEIETVNSWKENNLDDSLIKEAVRIALNDGVYKLKYIDKILFDFKSRGYQSVSDIKKEPVKEELETAENVEIFDWDWLDDEEEYIVN